MSWSKEIGCGLDKLASFGLLFFPFYIAYATIPTRGIFSLTRLPWGGTTHFISITTLWLSSFILFRRMKYLHPLARIVAIMMIAVFHIHTYDFMWALQNSIVRGQPTNVISFIIMCLTYLGLDRMSNIHGLFKNPATIKLVLIGGLIFMGFIGMYLTDFWGKMERVDQGEYCIDPNQNIFWVLSKVPSFFLVLPFIDDRDIKAPLELRGNVLTW